MSTVAEERIATIEAKQKDIDAAWVEENKAKEALTQDRKYREKLQEELGELCRSPEEPLLEKEPDDD